MEPNTSIIKRAFAAVRNLKFSHHFRRLKQVKQTESLDSVLKTRIKDFLTTMASAETPLMRQYTEVKSRYHDALLFFRMGDFYELFNDDALVASKILDIALTTRNKNDPNAIPMCGFPHHSATNYLNKLVSSGHKVAICEQLEDPSQAKGIVKRDVIRVISPGTRLDPDSLEAKAPNFTHAALRIDETIHWATCDFTTGKFWFGASDTLQDWIAYANSQGFAEVLFPESEAGNQLLLLWREVAPAIFSQTVPAFYFDHNYSTDRTKEQFQVSTLSAVHPHLATHPEAVGALVKYFQETQKAPRIPSVIKLELWGNENRMELDPATVRALELLPAVKSPTASKDVSLLSFVDRTKTAMGGRLLREWVLNPLTKIESIEDRLNLVEALLSISKEFLPLLNEVYDLERLLSRLSLSQGTTANARELLATAHSIQKSNEILVKLCEFKNLDSLKLDLQKALTNELVAHSEKTLQALISPPPATTREGGLFQKGFRPDLDELIDLSQNGEQWLAQYEAQERSATNISSLKVRFNRVFGYYIEITKANLKSVPTHYIRKQTTVSGERYITEELKQFEEKILTAEKKRCDLEYALFKEFCQGFTEMASSISATAKAIARFDALCSLSQVASEEQYVRPILDNSKSLEILEGRHPTVAVMLARSRSGSVFVPNTVKLTSKNPFLLITGPNMGGKSTVMRQTALITLMAQIGSFVPAQAAQIGLVDRIFTRIGANDNTAEGSSTFMVEMSEMSFILRHATEKSLILIDEIGRGTSTYDGMSLAWALASNISQNIKARTLFATHYHELTQLAERFNGITNARVAVALTEGPTGPTVRFLYRLEPGVAERSYGILVARLAGLPEELLSEAEAMLKHLESQAKKPAKNAGDRNQLQLNLLGARISVSPVAPPIERKISAAEKWIQDVKLEELTPLQALNKLAELKVQIQSPL